MIKVLPLESLLSETFTIDRFLGQIHSGKTCRDSDGSFESATDEIESRVVSLDALVVGDALVFL